MLHACVRWFSPFRNLGFGPARPVWHPDPLPLSRHFATSKARRSSSVDALGAEKEGSGPEERSPTAQIGRSYSHAEDQQILLRRKQGASYRDIGAELGRSAPAVAGRHRRLILLYGHEGEIKRYRFPRKSKFMAEEDAYIIRRMAEAASFTTIASELASHSRQDVNTRWRDLVALGKVSGISTLKERQEGMTDGQYKHILALREKGLKWREIASHLQQRLAIVKNTFYLKSLQQNANAAFQRWTDADIAMLTRLREEDRKSWTEIANTMNRSYKSVTAKYHEVSPRVSGPAHRSRVHWTKTEDEKLLQLVKQHGTKWSSLSGLIESRTVHAMRQRYTGTLRKS